MVADPAPLQLRSPNYRDGPSKTRGEAQLHLRPETQCDELTQRDLRGQVEDTLSRVCGTGRRGRN